MADIKFDIKDKLIFLDTGIISAEGSSVIYLPVVLDKSSTTTILPADILVNLGYDSGHPGLPRVRLIAGSGVSYAPSVLIKGLIGGGEKIDNVNVLCHDLPTEAGIDGLLGLNLLKKFDFAVEYSSGRLRFLKIQA